MPPDNPTTILAGGRVLAGAGLEPKIADVVIEQGVVRDVRSPCASPEEAAVIDCSGLTLMPGFIDAHVHIGFCDPAEVLLGGVTTVRDLAWPRDEIFTASEASRAVSFDGPEILAAGQMLTAPGGYPTTASWAPAGTGREVSSPSEGSVAVAEQAELGACVIKVALNPPAGPVLDETTLAAIVEAAHSSGLRVTGHVHGLGELRKAIDCGVDELAHMLLGSDEIPDDLNRAMVGASMVVVPTLSCRFDDLPIAIRNLARFLDQGGAVVYGTDLGNEGPRPGIDRREVEAMERAGMSPTDIVVSATAGAAAYLGLNDRGAIEPERRADMVVLDGDPASDLDALERIRLVVRGGSIRARGPNP